MKRSQEKGGTMENIQAGDVVIRTAAITVKTARLEGRQLTLSVMRQLPWRPVIDISQPQLRFQGEPWGWVNYHWDGCGYGLDREDHLHVLWVRDERLYRACVGRLGIEKAEHLATKRGGSFCEPLWHAYGDPYGLLRLSPDLEPRCWTRRQCVLLPDAHDKERTDVAVWNDLYGQLSNLDQLFIAS